MFCPNCGNKMIDGKPFCTNCGERLDATSQASQQPQNMQPQSWTQPQATSQSQYRQSWTQPQATSQSQYRQSQPQATSQSQYRQSQFQDEQPSRPRRKTLLGLILGVSCGIVLLVVGLVVGLFIYNKSDKAGSSTRNNYDLKADETPLNTEGSSGFNYIFTDDGYVITSIGICSDGEVVIPQGIENEDGEIVPYLWDEKDGFTGMDKARSVILPEGTREIRKGFANSGKLEFIYIPGTVNSICADLVANCPALKEIIYAGTIDEWNAVSKDNGWNSGLDANPNFVIFCADGKIMSDGSSAAGNSNGTSNANGIAGTPDTDGDSGNSDNATALGGSPSEVADALSTTDYAHATDFEWFIDVVDGDGTGAGVVITYPDKVERLIGDQSDYLNGGWKAFMYGSDKASSYNSECERYFNAVIDTNGNDFNITLNWKYVDFGDGSIEESGSDLCKGTWDAASGTASATGSFCNVKIDNFYISKDGSAMYAVGSFIWQSGELDSIALMRTAQ